MNKRTFPGGSPRWIVGIILISALVLGIAWSAFSQPAEEDAGAPAEVTRVRRGDLIIATSGAGTLQQISLPLGFVTSGTLVDVAQPGDVILAGEILVQLDDRQALLDLQEAELKWQEQVSIYEESALQAQQLVTQKLLEDTQQKYDEVVNGPDVDYYEALLSIAVGDYWEAVRAVESARASTNPKISRKLPRLKEQLQRAEIALEAAEESLYNALHYYPNPTNVLMVEAELASVESQLATQTILVETLAKGELSFGVENGSSLPELQVIQNAWDALEQARMMLDYTRLLAPFDGTVTQVNMQIGEQINAYQPVLTLVAQEPLTVRFLMDESDLQNLTIGDALYLTLTAYPNLQLAGVVTQIAPTVDANTAQVVVWGQILPDDQIVNILPGMNVDVEVVLAEAQETLLLPQQAIRTRADGTFYVNRILADGSVQETSVTLGLSDFANIEILSGLQEGDVVSTAAEE